MDRKLSEQQYRLDSQPSIAPTPEIQRQLSLDDGQWQLLSHQTKCWLGGLRLQRNLKQTEEFM
jgi:hypothetical protein